MRVRARETPYWWIRARDDRGNDDGGGYVVRQDPEAFLEAFLFGVI